MLDMPSLSAKGHNDSSQNTHISMQSSCPQKGGEETQEDEKRLIHHRKKTLNGKLTPQ